MKSFKCILNVGQQIKQYFYFSCVKSLCFFNYKMNTLSKLTTYKLENLEKYNFDICY